MARPKQLETLRKRAAFLAVAASGKKWVAPGLVVQIREQDRPGQATVEHTAKCRFGLTASRKVGNAAKRNRARRRLRALVHEILSAHAVPGHDYVLIARPATVSRSFNSLRQDLETALKRLKAWRDN